MINRKRLNKLPKFTHLTIINLYGYSGNFVVPYEKTKNGYLFQKKRLSKKQGWRVFPI